MKNRKILLPALFSITLVFSLIALASILHTAPVIAQGHVMPLSDIENVTWVLESCRESSESGMVSAFQCSAIKATFEGGRISGYAGCNCYEGDYELKGNNLSITELINTEMWCGELINELEQKYLTALRNAESYEIEGGKLRINCGNRLLVFNEGYNGMEWWPWIIVASAAVAGLVIFFVRRRRHA